MTGRERIYLDRFYNEFSADQARVDAVSTSRQPVATATDLYREGVTDFLSVLGAQRSLAAAEDNLVQSDHAISIDLVVLLKALGGRLANRLRRPSQ